MPADYSNLSATTARTIAVMSELQRDIPDEALLEAAQRIVPPLLPSVLMAELEFQLDVRKKLRGRRRFGAPTRQGLIARLSKIRRDDVPPLFFDALITRLRKGRRKPDILLASRIQNYLDRQRTKMFIRGLYRDFKALMGDDHFVIHPVLGRLELPQLDGSPSERALALTEFVMREKLGEHPPSRATMMNIISQNSRHNRE